MTSKDRVPMNMPFPVGNWIDPVKEHAAEDWIALLETQSSEQFMDRVEERNRLTAISCGTGSRIYKTHQAALKLCKQWDEASGNGKHLATYGYQVAMAFNRATHYLPAGELDFTEDMRDMQREKQDLAREFARTAWNGMADYMYVHDKFERIFRHCFTRFYLADESDIEYFKAGMALPYMLGWGSGLSEHMSKQSA